MSQIKRKPLLTSSTTSTPLMFPCQAPPGKTFSPHDWRFDCPKHGSTCFAFTSSHKTLPLSFGLKKTSFDQIEDPVLYQALDGMAELKRLASEGRPIYLVEDMHPTRESRLAMRFRLKEEGIDLVGVAILAASDIRMTMRGRHKAYYSKYARLTNSTREESSKIIHTFLQGKFQKSSHKLEQSLGGKDAAQAPTDFSRLPPHTHVRVCLSLEWGAKMLRGARKRGLSAI